MYHELKIPLMNIFIQSLSTGIFPGKMEFAKVSPMFKNSKKTIASNYRPISVLPYFSKILERIMYNRLYSYLTENNVLLNKQFGFQAGHSTEHALLELVDQISNKFNDKNYLLCIFFDFSKAFDTVDHKILTQKLEHYRINGQNLSWFKNYLTNWKQYIQYDGNNNNNGINNNNSNNNINSNFEQTELLDIICGVP